jgi:hypothetical protein
MVYFNTKKSQFWYILDGLVMEKFGVCHGHLIFSVSCWYILRPFGIFCGQFAHFSHFGLSHQEKSGNPGCFGQKCGHHFRMIHGSKCAKRFIASAACERIQRQELSQELSQESR